MMRRFFGLVILIVIGVQSVVARTPNSTAQATIHTTAAGIQVNYDLPTAVLSPAKNGTRIEIADWELSQHAGAPQLPVKHVLIAVPAGKRAVLQSWNTPIAQTFRGQPVIQPSQHVLDQAPTAESLPQTSMTTQIDPAFQRAAFPAQAVALGSPMKVRDQTLVSLDLYAAQWNGQHQRTTIFASITAHVVFVDADASTTRPDPLWNDTLRGMVVNPAAISTSVAPQETKPAVIENTVGVRLTLPTTGVYSVTFASLVATGAPASWANNPQFLRVFQGATELPRVIEAQGLTFYLPPYSTLQTDRGGAVIRYTPGQVGLTPATRTVGSATTGATTYLDTVHYEEQTFYVTRFPIEEQSDHWWGSYWFIPGNGQAGTPIVTQLALPAQALVALPGQLRLRLYGYVSTQHAAQVWLNGTLLDTLAWNGSGVYEPLVAIPAATLQATNVISIAPQGTAYDVMLLDWINLDFQRPLSVQDGRVAFTGNDQAYVVSGLAGAAVDVWDVTQPIAPQRLVGWVNDSNTLRWSDAGTRQYIVQQRSQYRAPQSLKWFVEPDLRSVLNGADYLAITYNPVGSSTWSDALDPLMMNHQAQGLRTRTIDVQWIYDQFGDGRVDPLAIRDFLQYSYNAWVAPAPSFVLLVGDGTNDPRNFYNASNPTINYIPPYLSHVDPWIGQTAADNKYVTLSGTDDIPDMMLGRVPARSVGDITTFVQKSLKFEQTDPAAAWLNRALFVADNPDSAGDFAAFSNDAIALLPSSVVTTTLYYQAGSDGVAFHASIVDAINQGQLFVNYIGHAGIDIWADQPTIYNVSSVNSLNNAETPSIMLEMTCYTGYYHDPSTQVLAERELLKSGGGSVATWAPTGLGIATGHDYLNRGFFDAIYNRNVRVIGVATMQGKVLLAASGAAPDLLNTYVLFGDPALKIPLAGVSAAATNDAYTFNQNISATSLDLVTNDVPAATSQIRTVTQPAHGSVSINRDGKSVTYTPELWFHGTDSFSYTVIDQASLTTSSAVVTLTINDTTQRWYVPLVSKSTP